MVCADPVMDGRSDTPVCKLDDATHVQRILIRRRPVDLLWPETHRLAKHANASEWKRWPQPLQLSKGYDVIVVIVCSWMGGMHMQA